MRHEIISSSSDSSREQVGTRWIYGPISINSDSILQPRQEHLNNKGMDRYKHQHKNSSAAETKIKRRIDTKQHILEQSMLK